MAILGSLVEAGVLLDQDQVADLKVGVENTEGIEGLAGFVLAVDHGHLRPVTFHTANATHPAVEVFLVWLERQGPGWLVAEDLLPLRPGVGGGEVTLERYG